MRIKSLLQEGIPARVFAGDWGTKQNQSIQDLSSSRTAHAEISGIALALRNLSNVSERIRSMYHPQFHYIALLKLDWINIYNHVYLYIPIEPLLFLIDVYH